MRMSDWSSDVCSSDLAFLDVISPCVAFNNHAGSTKSYEYVREHNDAVNRMDVILPRAEIAVEYGEGKLIEVEQHDGSLLSSEQRSVGNECVSTCLSRWSPYHQTKHKNEQARKK